MPWVIDGGPPGAATERSNQLSSKRTCRYPEFGGMILTPRESTSQLQLGMTEHCTIWEPLPGIAFPCAGISLSYHHKTDLQVLMHFSKVVNGPGQDLLLTFRGVIGFRWNPEDLGSVFYPAGQPLPNVTDSRWKE